MFDEEKRTYTIKDIYAQNVSENKPMLSDYTSDFWAGYRANYAYFDRRFKKLYTSWFPFDQESEEGRAAVADEFRADVYAHLMANDKRYSELFRVNSIDDEDYSLLDNYNMSETYSEETHFDRAFDKGAQTDGNSGFTAYGEQQVDEDLSRTYGLHETETENSTSADNETTLTPTDKTAVSDKEHTVTEDNTTTYGTHRDDTSSTRTEGARHDVTDDDGTKTYTMSRVGNIGVTTATDMMQKATEFWDMFSFYDFIFAEIARDLLRGVM